MIECKESTALHRRAGGRHLERVLGNCVAPDARATTGIFREAQKDERYGSARTSPVQPIPRRPAGVSGMQEIAPCDAPAPTLTNVCFFQIGRLLIGEHRGPLWVKFPTFLRAS